MKYKKLYISYVIILIYNYIRNILYLYFIVVGRFLGLNLKNALDVYN